MVERVSHPNVQVGHLNFNYLNWNLNNDFVCIGWNQVPQILSIRFISCGYKEWFLSSSDMLTCWTHIDMLTCWTHIEYIIVYNEYIRMMINHFFKRMLINHYGYIKVRRVVTLMHTLICTRMMVFYYSYVDIS